MYRVPYRPIYNSLVKVHVCRVQQHIRSQGNWGKFITHFKHNNAYIQTISAITNATIVDIYEQYIYVHSTHKDERPYTHYTGIDMYSSHESEKAWVL